MTHLWLQETGRQQNLLRRRRRLGKTDADLKQCWDGLEIICLPTTKVNKDDIEDAMDNKYGDEDAGTR